ncbi:MAG: glycosyltransferase [Candidatus Competibacteraceae bacterium]|nr:glycosyltransferase [Candidatus Competibacteraceae bacterium]
MSSIRPGLAYVVNSLNPGGTEKLVVEMSLAFAPEYDLQVFCLDETGLWAGRLREQGIPVYGLWRQPGLDMAMPVKLAWYFRRHRTRIVHAHQCTPWFYAALARLLYPAPRLLLEEHGRFFPEVENRKRAWFNRWIIKPLTHRFVAVSEDVQERLRRYEGLLHQAITVVYNGVALGPRLDTATRAALRREWSFTPDDFVIGTVGRFDPIKNLPLLVNSLARAGAEAPNIRGLLVGDGSELGATRALIERLKLTDRARLTGFRDDARTLVQCMDLFVLSSLSEGTSMALLEAMAAGIPVAVTAVGGNPEVVVKDQTGWVVPSDSVEALTDVLLEAVNDPEKRQAFARAGRQRFEDCFTFDHMIETYRNFYRDMLARTS